MHETSFIDSVAHSWNLTTEPVRPTAFELDFFRSRLRKEKISRKVLMLGLTPELVDFLVDPPAEFVTIMDKRQVAFDALQRFGKADWSSIEAIVGDWRTNQPMLVEQFDYVVGHGSFVLLPFPDDWRIALKNIYDYLKKDGTLIIRTFLMPSGGFNFFTTYSALVASFEEAIAQNDDGGNLANFMKTVTQCRCAAMLSAAQPNGTIDHAALDEINSWIYADFSKRFVGKRFWQTLEPEFESPTARGYETMWPVAAPRWEAAKAIFEESGFSVAVDFIGEKPVPNCFCIVTAKKAKG